MRFLPQRTLLQQRVAGARVGHGRLCWATRQDPARLGPGAQDAKARQARTKRKPRLGCGTWSKGATSKSTGSAQKTAFNSSNTRWQRW